jgi:phosphatidylglycerol:prolipoprotein diacylglycerol transferase
VHSEAIHLGPLTIHWYGIMVAAGFLVGLWSARGRAVREGFAPELAVDFGPWLLVGAIVGARLLYVVSYWDVAFAGKPWWEVFMIQKGGLVYYGGFVGAVCGAAIFCRKRGISFLKAGDLLAPSIALGQVFGRIGCYLNGCCYGFPTDVPWACHFPHYHETHGIGVHPVQLYEAAACFGLFVVLALWHRRKQLDGEVFAGYMAGYGLVRSNTERFRGDYSSWGFGERFTPGQSFSLLLLAGAICLGLWLIWRRKRAGGSVLQ